MTQATLTLPLTKATVEYFTKEARRRKRKDRKFVSRAAIIREVLEQHIASQKAAALNMPPKG